VRIRSWYLRVCRTTPATRNALCDTTRQNPCRRRREIAVRRTFLPLTVISPLKPPRTFRTPMYGISFVFAGVVASVIVWPCVMNELRTPPASTSQSSTTCRVVARLPPASLSFRARFLPCAVRTSESRLRRSRRRPFPPLRRVGASAPRGTPPGLVARQAPMQRTNGPHGRRAPRCTWPWCWLGADWERRCTTRTQAPCRCGIT
jgi:hypothetical protein